MMRARFRHLWGLAVVCAAIAGSGPAAAAAVSENYVFDPVLSLTGSPKPDAVDPIPDPGVGHPPLPFTSPRAITTDSHGNIYVASWGTNEENGEGGRIDIFDSGGFFIGELEAEGPIDIAVDSKGRLYVVERPSAFLRLVRFDPTVYNSATGEIEYDPTPTAVVAEAFVGSRTSIAVNPLDDHLFIHYGINLTERASADEGNAVVDESIGNGVLADEAISVAVDAAHNRIYASDTPGSDGVVRVFELASPHNLVNTIDGSETPLAAFGIQPAIAADEGTGRFFVFDGGEDGAKVVHEFSEAGAYMASVEYGIKDIGNAVKIWVDNGANSPNGALNPKGRYLFVPSHPTGTGHAFAYGPPAEEVEPVIESLSFAEVSRTDAELRATINPGNLPSGYIFEFTTQQHYEEEGNSFAGASITGEGQIPAGKAGVPVSAAATGLAPGTVYRFRVVATNEKGSDEEEGQFTTYPAAPPVPPCPNDSLRTGLSALLPDCRAYELVTPPDTNARSPVGRSSFPSLLASPVGGKVSFRVMGGTIPGYEGTGYLFGDPYLATRAAGGWVTASAGATGGEAAAILPGGVSPDQGYSSWNTASNQGSAVVPGAKQTMYVRYPDGHSELVGRGSIDVDPRAEVRLISANGGHIVFVSGSTPSEGPAIQLEPDAPLSGTVTIYDRTGDEVTQVVSLLPGDETPDAGEHATYRGASFDGEGVAFTIGGTLYLRHDNEDTYEIGTGVTFAGVAEGGNRIFFVEGGKLRRFDALTGLTTDFNSSGTAIPVNVSADGSAAYFVSASVLTSVANPNGEKAKAGFHNLYLSREGAISFVGRVTERDVDGELLGVEQGEGLGLSTLGLDLGTPGIDPSRTAPDGTTLLFESRANLDDWDPEGHAQVYRYDFDEGELDCLSCNPTGAPAAGAASLQSLRQGDLSDQQRPLSSGNRLANLRADGRRAIFQSEEALVPEDTDGLQDVYEWEDQGVGSCTSPGGCIYLISSGQSARVDYLYAVSGSGDDVFFHSADLLASADADETPSIYDARVGGGFAEAVPICQESQICRLPQAPAPFFPTPASGATGPSGNVKAHSKRCGKGKRKVRRNGKVRCVKKHRKRNRKAGSGQRGGRR